LHHLERATPLRAEMAALLTVAIWGTSFAFQKMALAQFNVSTFIALRYAGMLALSWCVLLYRLRFAPRAARLDRRDLPGLALAGVLGYGLYIPLSTLGLSFTTAFSNALLIATTPLFAALLLRVLRLERIGSGHYAGMLLALAGVVLFMLPAMHRGVSVGGVGDLVSLAAALFFAAYTVATKPLLPRYALPAIMAYTLTLGTVPVILVLLPRMFAQDWSHVTRAGWAAFAWTIIFPVYVAWSIWNWTVGQIGVARATLFMYLVPVIGGLTSWLLLAEGFGILKIAGAILTLGGLAVARRAETSVPPRQTLPVPAVSD